MDACGENTHPLLGFDLHDGTVVFVHHVDTRIDMDEYGDDQSCRSGASVRWMPFVTPAREVKYSIRRSGRSVGHRIDAVARRVG
jgi:hypothetical protein